MRLFLEFTPTQSPAHRRRLTYAFRLFCAIYDHEPVTDPVEANSTDAWLSYRTHETTPPAMRFVCLSDLYTPRSRRDPAPPPTRRQFEDEHTVLFYQPRCGGTPDWLAEIFEWVSCADEYSVKARDSVGRIPFESSYSGRYQLDIHRPYAAVAMRLLHRELCRLAPACHREATHPVAPHGHCIVNTHDVDFLPLDWIGRIKRSAKNALISLLHEKTPRLAARQAAQTLRAAVGGHDALDQIPALLAGELERSIGASWFFISSSRHRRDANYRLEQPQALSLLHELIAKGMEVGVHGSYSSLDQHDRLRHEFLHCRALGFDPKGGRQHWLRFTLDRLIREVERAGAIYDASLGWGDQAGFRAGACFAFPPYDFEQERPATFLEIPMVIMDKALHVKGKDEETLYETAAELLAASRRYGWGGISLLWHPTAFGGCQLSPEIGRVFWKLLDSQEAANDTWTSAADFVSAIRERYSRVGLPIRETLPEYSAHPAAI